MSADFMKKFLLVFFTLTLAACSENEEKKHIFQAEEIIHFEKPSFACMSGDLYMKAIQHSVNGENSKFASMFSDFECFRIPENIDFRILSTRTSIAINGIEITNATNVNKSKGLFTASDFAVLSKSEPNIKK